MGEGLNSYTTVYKSSEAGHEYFPVVTSNINVPFLGSVLPWADMKGLLWWVVTRNLFWTRVEAKIHDWSAMLLQEGSWSLMFKP